MGRILFVSGLVCMALGLVALPAVADEDEGLRREVEKLRQEVQVMRSSMLEKEIDSYLSESDAWRGAQGGTQGVTIHARFTAVFQGAFVDATDIGIADGDVDLDFTFQVTDNLTLFIKMTANNGTNSTGTGFFPANFPLTGNPPYTFASWSDGIGVNGTVPTKTGSVISYEAGIYHVLMIGDTKLHWEMGEIDPRTRFLQNAFADDENTQFINNSFDDSAAVLWLTGNTSAGPGFSGGYPQAALGWHMWINFGDNQQFTLNWGYWNVAGEWFKNGQFYIQFSWKGEISGRETNLRAMAIIDEFYQDSSGDGSASGGVSWDWYVADKIGIFMRVVANGEDINPVEFDGSFGVVFMGLISSRPDDTLGIAVGFLQANENVIGTGLEDQEFTLEVYYRFMAEDGKLQITPHLILVSDPGGGTDGPWQDDTLFILGLRIHVPF